MSALIAIVERRYIQGLITLETAQLLIEDIVYNFGD